MTTCSTAGAIRLLVISCWLLSGGSGHSTTDFVPICEEINSPACIPIALVPYLGKPMSRDQIASKFKMKSRLNDAEEKPKRSSRRIQPEVQTGNESVKIKFSNTVDISGDPNETFYNISKFQFDPNKKVVIIIHGWSILNKRITEERVNFSEKSREKMEKSTVRLPQWVVQLQQKILATDDVTAVVHDWRSGSLHGYSKSKDNTWTAGYELFLFIKSLIEQRGSRPEKIHLIGHSLGCHVASLAAKKINKIFEKKFGKIGRISAMDPAQPLYHDAPAEVHLNKSDTTLLDVYHTDGYSSTFISAGILNPIGHLDFYPNNGTDQPHCHSNSSLDPAGLGVCDHLAAYQYYIESVEESYSGQMAIRCDSFSNYKNGFCSKCSRQGCVRSGYFLDRHHHQWNRPGFKIRKRNYGKYYYETLPTRIDDSFCAKEILIDIDVSRQMFREVRKKRKFGLGSKLVYNIKDDSSGMTHLAEHSDDLDKIIEKIYPKRKSRNIRNKRISFATPVPCSIYKNIINSKQITLSVKQNCQKLESKVSNFFRSLLTGGCGDSKLYVNRVRISSFQKSKSGVWLRPSKSAHENDDSSSVILRMK